MLLEHLLKGCGAKGNFDCKKDIRTVCCNSKNVTEGSLFIALKGTNTDGRAYIREAIEKGAAYVVVEGDFDLDGVPFVSVPDARTACARIFSNFYGNPDVGMKTVCITGTNGKTTVAALLEHIYNRDGRKTGLLGTVFKRDSFGDFASRDDTMTTSVPEKLYDYLGRMRKRGVDTVILEASSHALALSKLEGMHVDIGVFTNLTPEHLDFHGTMDNYYRAKRRLFEKAQLSVINTDDPYGKRLISEFPSAFGISVRHTDAFASASMYESCGFSGIRYLISGKDFEFPVTSAMIGETALYNTLIAAATALCDGVSQKVISEAIYTFKGVKGRFETVFCGENVPRVIIDYAHTPASFERALCQTRRLMKHGSKLIAVFGCGGERDRSKRASMGASAEKYSDIAVVTDDNSRGEEPAQIRRDILKGVKNGENVFEIDGRRAALEFAVAQSKKEDVILVLGKGHEEYIIDKYGSHPFSEREIIKNAILSLYSIEGDETSS